MYATTIDTLQITKRLQNSGVEPKVAEEFAEIMKESGQESINGLATKIDIKDVRNEIKDVRNEVKDVRNEIKGVRNEIKNMEERIDHKINTMFYKLLASISGIMVVSIGVITWLSKIIH